MGSKGRTRSLISTRLDVAFEVEKTNAHTERRGDERRRGGRGESDDYEGVFRDDGYILNFTPRTDGETNITRYTICPIAHTFAIVVTFTFYVLFMHFSVFQVFVLP